MYIFNFANIFIYSLLMGRSLCRLFSNTNYPIEKEKRVYQIKELLFFRYGNKTETHGLF